MVKGSEIDAVLAVPRREAPGLRCGAQGGQQRAAVRKHKGASRAVGGQLCRCQDGGA